MNNLHLLSLSEMVGQLNAGACSSVDLVEALIARKQATDYVLNAYIVFDEADALAQARAADERRAKGDAAPLLGVPIGVKDLINVKGQPCSCGSKLLRPYTSPYDATAIERLREAGAIICGRMNMDEFGMGSSNENSSYGSSCNPWDPARVPGGSSGGSAAAVAADSAVACLGSDTGGSIRQPASFCGCVGLKPSYGRISRYGLTAYASSLDQIGSLTKSVGDAALMLQAMAGWDERDSTSLNVPVPDYTAALQPDLKGIKLGLPKEFFVEGIDPEVAAAIHAAVEQCRALGAEIVDVHIPHIKYAIAAYYVIATAEASTNLARFDGVRYGDRQEGGNPEQLASHTRAAGFGTEVKRRIILGTYVLSSGYYDAYYLRAQKVRSLIRQDFEQAFSQCDAILGPVAPTAAYPLGDKLDDPLQMYLGDICTVPLNLAGICGLSVPCGFTSNELPVGLQIMGPTLGEEILFRVGHAYEQATDWHTRKPTIGGAA
ncbi:MAG: aspartyl-tRNA(Asn)/glutamyl-tRNA(Gln) amidotransferase subunit A [Candidatus Omnitrophota bacterium]|jgi:aspartyl-tRNA(Asn)/glutamyl-tRNA(Gln) amidotransferase subunit A